MANAKWGRRPACAGRRKVGKYEGGKVGKWESGKVERCEEEDAWLLLEYQPLGWRVGPGRSVRGVKPLLRRAIPRKPIRAHPCHPWFLLFWDFNHGSHGSHG